MLSLAALALSPLPLGRYFQGTGSGDNNTFEFLPGNRYEYTFDGCFGGHTSKGKFIISGNELKLDPPVEHDKRPFTRFVVIPWGERTYLISPGEMAGFCAAYQKGWRGKDAPYDIILFRDGVDRKSEEPALAPAGTPIVPSPWQAQLTKPLRAHILSIEDANVEIDLGTKEGVESGTVFGDPAHFLVVTDAQDHHAKGTWGTYDSQQGKTFAKTETLSVADLRLSFSARLLLALGFLKMPESRPKTKS